MMQITLERSTLEKLLHQAAFAAHLIGHLDDNVHPDLIGQLGDNVDAVVHGLTEILGDPRVRARGECSALATNCAPPTGNFDVRGVP